VDKKSPVKEGDHGAKTPWLFLGNQGNMATSYLKPAFDAIRFFCVRVNFFKEKIDKLFSVLLV
jgi:hypothetical protein